MRYRSALALAVVLMACRGTTHAPERSVPPTQSSGDSVARPSAASPDCRAKAAELRAFLTAVFDPAQTVAPPWPTGDDKLDADIDTMRARVRTWMKPRDPADMAPDPGREPEPDRLELALADCPPARGYLAKVGAAHAAQRAATLIDIARPIEACHCEVDIGWVKALLYMGQRGPD